MLEQNFQIKIFLSLVLKKQDCCTLLHGKLQLRMTEVLLWSLPSTPSSAYQLKEEQEQDQKHKLRLKNKQLQEQERVIAGALAGF